MLFNKDKDSQLFLQRLTKLTPEEFIALGKILDVKMSIVNAETGEYAVRDAEEIIDDMVAAFRHFKHKERQLILKAMTVHKPTKEIVEDVQNGPLS
jgi:hypothetical protein